MAESPLLLGYALEGARLLGASGSYHTAAIAHTVTEADESVPHALPSRLLTAIHADDWIIFVAVVSLHK